MPFKRDKDPKTRLEKIGEIFDIDKLTRISPDTDYIKDYYNSTRWAYRLLYSWDDQPKQSEPKGTSSLGFTRRIDP